MTYSPGGKRPCSLPGNGVVLVVQNDGEPIDKMHLAVNEETLLQRRS
jgi:hypothetical protein